MKTYTLKKVQLLNVSLEEAWDFLSTPRNLTRITPEDMKFDIVSIEDDREAYPGQIIKYKIQLFPMVKFNWVTEITQLKDKEYFIDEQRFGPYKFWHHQHILRETSRGVEMIDIVTYGIPFGILGRVLHKLYIKSKLQQIFNFRQKAIEFALENQIMTKKVA